MGGVDPGELPVGPPAVVPARPGGVVARAQYGKYNAGAPHAGGDQHLAHGLQAAAAKVTAWWLTTEGVPVIEGDGREGRAFIRHATRLETRLALDLLQVAHDLDRPETAVPAEGPDGGDLAGPGPARDGLRVDPEHLGHLRRRQKGIGVGTVLHRRSSLYGYWPVA